MKRSNRFIVRVVVAVSTLIVGALVALVRCLMGHEFYTCLVVSLIACWCILPSRAECDALQAAQTADSEAQ